MGLCPRDPRVAPPGRLVGRGRWHARRPASVPEVPYQVGQACRHVRRAIGPRAGALVFWLARPPLGISARGGPRAGRSAAGSGASVRCGGPPVSSVAVIVGSSHGGWAGAAGGVAALSASCAASRVWPSGTGAGLGWPPTWPASPRLPSVLSAAAGLAAGVPPLQCGIPVGSSRPRAFARGASAGTVACVGSGSGSGPGPGDCQMAFPWAVLPVWQVGGGAVGTPALPVPGPADGTPGPTCWVLLELGDWGSRWGCGRTSHSDCNTVFLLCLS